MMKIAGTRAKRGRADYGIDAPHVIRFIALLGVGFGLSSGLITSFRKRSVALAVAGPALAVIGSASFGVAISMLAYSVRGKLTLRDRLIGMIDWRGDEHVLDIGTGRGLLMIGAAQRLKSGTALGIDIWNAANLSGNRAENALRNAEIEGVRSKVLVRSEDARRLTAADNSFDVIFSVRCLHTIDGIAERAEACREIARVLKPGGTVLLADSTATHQFAGMLGAAGLIVERSRPCFRDALTYVRIVAATKPL